MEYIVKIEQDEDGFLATFPDVPEAITAGDTREEALEEAKDALLSALEGYMKLKKPVPQPSTRRMPNDDVIYLPEAIQGKVLIWNDMCAAGVSKTDLAGRLGKSESYVRRLLNPYENVTINSLMEAARALNRRIIMTSSAIDDHMKEAI